MGIPVDYGIATLRLFIARHAMMKQLCSGIALFNRLQLLQVLSAAVFGLRSVWPVARTARDTPASS